MFALKNAHATYSIKKNSRLSGIRQHNLEKNARTYELSNLSINLICGIPRENDKNSLLMR